jgi:hypothetical protein
MTALRFTGSWPVRELWDTYPNWEYALDEEDIPDQDETTLRPSLNQSSIDDDVAYTVGEIYLADGSVLPALIELIAGQIAGVTAFTLPDDGWTVRLLGSPSRWSCISEHWLPHDERRPEVSPKDSSVFPARLQSRLSYIATGSVLQCHVSPTT